MNDTAKIFHIKPICDQPLQINIPKHNPHSQLTKRKKKKPNQTLEHLKTENDQQTHKAITPFEIISAIITGPIEAGEYAKLCTTGPVRTAKKEKPGEANR